MERKKNELLYLKIAGMLEQQILREVFRPGDKLPSLRSVSRTNGVSLTTALQAYYHLESKSLIQARPQSGYFVSNAPGRFPKLPEITNPQISAGEGDITSLIQKVYQHPAPKDHVMLSLALPAGSLLPVAKLNKGVITATRRLKNGGTAYEHTQGNERLRRQVARHALTSGCALDHQDIIVTAGCVDAIASALMVITEPGDTVAVESPVSFGMLQLIRSLRLKVLELPTHPQTGIEVAALEQALKKGSISACLLISNFSNPLGSLMPDAHKKEVVQLVEKYQVPLIENDVNGDLHFGSVRPRSCKSYDKSGIVLWCSSVSKTLAPGYRVGWVSPGKFKDELLQLKLYHAIAGATITQEVIADFMETGRYEHHLRKLRHTLHTNYLHFSGVVSQYFPEGSRASRPAGGTVLWVELPEKADTMQLFEKALTQKISIAPGRLFTLQAQYENCMRLNYGVLWNADLANDLKRLGTLAKIC